jgi:nucleotide-binding universal stress UspA family protein
MFTTEENRMKILIAYDGSACADAALHELRRAGLPLDAETVILSVADVWMPSPTPTSQSLLTTNLQRRAALAREATRAQALLTVEEAQVLAQRAYTQMRSYFPDWHVEVEAVADSPAWGIIKKADAWKPDLIVVGSHGYSAVSRFLLGSVSQKVLTTSGRNVRIARESSALQDAPVRLLLGVDGSAEANAMVRTVSERVWRPGSVACVVAVVDLPLLGGALAWEADEDLDARQRIQCMVDTAAAQLRATDLTVTTAVKEGDPKRVLIEEASIWGAECIFLGARGLRRVERFLLGSVSTAVATRAQCSVEIVQQAVSQ